MATATAPAHSAPVELAKAQLSIKSWIENKAAMPAFIGLLSALILRGTQVWSFGSFRLSALPAPVQTLFDALTGFAIAASLELLMSASGAQWWRLRSETLTIEFDTSKPKKEREKLALKAAKDATMYRNFAILGAVCSMGGNVYFAVTSTHNGSIGAIIVDILIASVITAGVFFFAVIYEPSRPDTTQLYQGAVEDRLHNESLTVASNIANGTATPDQIAFLKGHVSPQMARSLDLLIPRDHSLEYWDTPRIMQFLGIPKDDNYEAAARDVRRKLQRASGEVKLGLRRKRKGAGWEAPQTSIMSIFLEEIEARMRSDSAPLLNGGSTASQPAPMQAGATADGQSAANKRRAKDMQWFNILREASIQGAPAAETSVPADGAGTF